MSFGNTNPNVQGAPENFVADFSSLSTRAQDYIKALLFFTQAPGKYWFPDEAFEGAELVFFRQTQFSGALVTMFTVPTGYYALFGRIELYNATGGAISVNQYWNDGASDFRINNVVSVPATGATGLTNLFVFEAGESFKLTPTGALNAFGFYLRFPIAKASRFRTFSKLTGFTGGGTPDLISTVPAGRVHWIVGALDGAIGSLPTMLQLRNMLYTNDTGAPRTVSFYQVPNGEVINTTNHFMRTQVGVATGGIFRCDNIPNHMVEGDRFYIASDSNAGGQLVWYTAYVVRL